jgi:hypothetical protein
MKTSSKAIGIFALVLCGALASGSAMAQHRGHGGGYGYGGGVRFGISLGVPLYGPAYYPAPYYAYPAPVYGYPAPAYAYPAPAYAYPGAAMGYPSPQEYVERGPAPAAPAPSQALGDWYYCAATQAYYPDVRECAAGWQRVPAQSSPR